MTTEGEPARSRASRRARAKGRGLRLKERDLDILLALAKMRLLKTSDLARLYFSAVGTCQKRLRRLYDAGLARAIATDLAAENRYALTRLGHGLLVRALDEGAVPAFRSAPRVDGRTLKHLDMLNQYRIGLAKGCASRGVRLVRFMPEWDLRAMAPDARLIPDAMFELALAEERMIFALEVDTGSEPPTTVRKKLEAYASHTLGGTTIFGAAQPVVLFVVPTKRRALALARASEGVGDGVFVAVAADVHDAGGVVGGFAPLAMLDQEGDRSFGLADIVQQGGTR